MINKVKDLKKVKLNSQDVLFVAKNLKRPTDIILPDGITAEDKALYEEWIVTILAIGTEVNMFKVGDIIEHFKGDRQPPTIPLNKEEYGDRIGVIHMNNIMFAIDKDNYEETKE